MCMGSPGGSCDRVDVGCCVECYQVVVELVHHHQSVIFSALLKCGPVKLLEHGGHARGVVVPIEGESSGPSLYHFYLMDVVCRGGIPNCGTVLNEWSY